ncbi:MAG: response regulator transcription factor [Planctomycetota bacterium]|jgi:two-component system alkaline phosphatase synthesis response regulator PhoP
MSSRILIVEDDPSIRLGLKRSLEFEGFGVDLARDGEEAIQRAFDKKPDLIVLDLMLPKVNGFEVCRTVRKYDSTIPIVILSAKGDEGDKVLGLELGADDYITKPFSIRELTARIKAALRRRKAMEGEVEAFEEGDLKIDFGGQTLTVNDDVKELSTREFNLLRHLIQNRGRVLSRDQILNKVWGYDYDGTPRTIDNFINKLRQKIEQDATDPHWILTVRGSGYKFRPAPD